MKPLIFIGTNVGRILVHTGAQHRPGVTFAQGLEPGIYLVLRSHVQTSGDVDCWGVLLHRREAA